MTKENFTVNPESTFGEVSSETLVSDRTTGLEYHKSETKVWKVICGVSAVVSVISLILGSYGFSKSQPLVGDGIFSCKYVTGSTGIYYIRTDAYYKNYPVYCDMDTAGGGWTLVAAVHENDIQGKCTIGDKWSSDQGFITTWNGSDYEGTKNWENTNIFGTINSLTNDDYKNMAYYQVQASNVMIWHVPNNIDIKEFSSKSFFKYYTTNDFLQNYGGTLKNLFANYAPLKHSGSNRFFEHIASPITYAKGSNASILQGIPFAQRDFAEPGFLQFRAFDTYGFPNAICPGVRITQGDSAQVCIGGGSTRALNDASSRKKMDPKKNCGDFAGWGGDPKKPAPNTTPSDTGKSQRDINSSIFIFVR